MCGMLMNSDLNKQIQFSISLVRTCFRLCKKTYLINFFFFMHGFFFSFSMCRKKEKQMMQQESCG